MTRKGLFLGSELPRVLVLAAIALVGWPLACIYGGRPSPPKTNVRPIAELPPLPPPDDSVVFAGTQDKTPLNFRDNPAYAELLERSRSRSAAALAAEARRDVTPRQLLQAPARYRGIPIHLEGTALRVSRNEVKDTLLTTKGHLYEAWVRVVDEPRFPVCLAFEVPPAGLPGGRDIQEYVGFDGYFFKLMAYDAGDGPRFAPLLVGRLGWAPNDATQGAEVQEKGWLDRPFPGLPYSRRHVMLALLGVMMVVTMGRIMLGLFGVGRRETVGTKPRATLMAESIEPDELTNFLRGEAGEDSNSGPS